MDEEQNLTDEEGEVEAGEDEGPKISLPEGIIMASISSGADLMDILGSLTAFLMPLNWLSDLVSLAVIQVWLIMKGGIGFKKQAVALTGNLIDIIPILDILPNRTAALLIAIYMINHR
jgi:hypothetical protein